MEQASSTHTDTDTQTQTQTQTQTHTADGLAGTRVAIRLKVHDEMELEELLRCQYLYSCTSKASKLSTLRSAIAQTTAMTAQMKMLTTSAEVASARERQKWSG